MRRLAPLVALSLALAACAGASANIAGEVSYAKDAKGNFERGEQSLKSHDFQEAAQYFQFTKNKFPYSHYAPLSELRLADANFEQEKYTEAIDGYKNFVKDHPTNPEVDYAAYRIALAHFQDIPSDFMLLPPSYEKDQDQILQAQISLKDFLSSYPDSKWVADGKKLLKDVRGRLARHELYVGDYYEKHGHPKAAAWRFEALAKNYPDSPYADEARRRAEQIYAKLGEGTRHLESRSPAQPAPPPSSGS
ncbi:MAG: outer membrane protein assembly factor BamD [Deltaproteobacteria bacterium]